MRSVWNAAPKTVYNFTVAGDHTYFVGKNSGGLWVHNIDCNIVIDEGKQGKHILGHNNYTAGNSILTADPDSLLAYAGKGTPANAYLRGTPGFKERVNFGFVIGKHIEKDAVTGAQIIRDTTNGIIHYAKKGLHIVPARP